MIRICFIHVATLHVNLHGVVIFRGGLRFTIFDALIVDRAITWARHVKPPVPRRMPALERTLPLHPD